MHNVAFWYKPQQCRTAGKIRSEKRRIENERERASLSLPFLFHIFFNLHATRKYITARIEIIKLHEVSLFFHL